MTLSARLRAAESAAFARVSVTKDPRDLRIFTSIHDLVALAVALEDGDAIVTHGEAVTGWCEPEADCLAQHDHESATDRDRDFDDDRNASEETARP